MLVLLPYIVILLAAFSGVALTIYIGQKKRRNKPLVCPLGQDCGAVIHSEYSRFLGIPLEYIGWLYYSLIAVSYIAYIIVPSLQGSWLSYITFALSFAAFLLFDRATRDICLDGTRGIVIVKHCLHRGYGSLLLNSLVDERQLVTIHNYTTGSPERDKFLSKFGVSLEKLVTNKRWTGHLRHRPVDSLE